MSLTTQIIVKGLDFEALTDVTGASHNQAIDEVTPGANYGLVVQTTDTGVTPEVPNPAGTYVGHTATWLSKCIWKRITATGVEYYKWDDNATSVATYLKWVNFDVTADAAYTLANTAKTNADDALDTAEAAAGTAQSAQASANSALALANSANNTANAISAQLAAFGEVPVGFILPCAVAAVYSTTTNEGWLRCDGTDILNSAFPELTALLGTTWGVASSSTTHTRLPDFRGRVLGGAGTGDGLVARTLGFAGNVGLETHALVAAELPAHRHFISTDESLSTATGNDLTDAKSIVENTDAVGEEEDYELLGTTTEPTIGRTSEVGSGTAHNNMQPTSFIHWYIKT